LATPSPTAPPAAGRRLLETPSYYFKESKGTSQCWSGAGIGSEQQCRDAARYLKIEFKGTGSSSSYPTGCYDWDACCSWGVYFNPHASGNKHSDATPICASTASPTPLPTQSPSLAPSPAPTFIPTFGALTGLKVSVNGITVEVQPTSQSWDGRRVTFQCLRRTRSPPLNPTGALLILSCCVLLPTYHVTMRLMQRGRAQTRGTSGTATTVTWPHAAAPRVGTGARTHTPMPGRCGSASRASHAPSARGASVLSLKMHRNAPNAPERSRRRSNAALPSQTTAVMQLCSSNP
jgi:hypothetical protein